MWASSAEGTVNPLPVWLPLSCRVLRGWWDQIGHHEKPGCFSLHGTESPLTAVVRGGRAGVPLRALGMTWHLGSVFRAGSSGALPPHLLPMPVALGLASPRVHLSLDPSLENCHILVRRASGDGVPAGVTVSQQSTRLGGEV